ncbi:hypothetical protein FRC10_009871, partial [Ceratobasidium sp. 414]
LLAAAGGFLQTSTITLAPKYGSGAITSYMAGSALSAVGVSLLQVATAYTSTGITLPDIDSASWSATICFMTSAMVLVLTLVLFRALGQEHYGFDRPESYKDFGVETPPSERTRLIRQRAQTPRIQIAQLESPARYYSCSFAIFYAGIITLCVFPAITATIEPINTAIDPLLFNAIHFLVFNIADLAGRSLASTRLLSSTNDTFLTTYSLSRTVFVPFFIACNVAGSSTPAIITSDTMYMLGLFLLGLTHGHCSTLSLVAASEAEDGEQQRRATRLTQFWMMAGIVAGGGASFGVRALL